MRTIPVILIALVLSACTAAVDSGDAVSPDAPDTTTSSATLAMPPQIADFRVKEVQVGDRLLTLAIADNPSLRQQGLMGVTDLGDLDGMLFFWRHDGDPFWMKDTLIPLDIVWFNEDGTYKDRASMVPCTEDPCERYFPADGLEFRYAIEAAPGTLDYITESSTIQYTDD
ncbi:hypothetical protein MNBD_ACTINO01-1197 [hydrothermal vent metagenome]|uniref:DUF192 domain-containing protein n=1 Tax=hydrothermal vent metagenome TaxID=652676 RepID=A0A3B0RR31_9ZZZZ